MASNHCSQHLGPGWPRARQNNKDKKRGKWLCNGLTHYMQLNKSLKTNVVTNVAMLANECCCGQRLNPKLTGRVTLQHSKGENVIVMCAQLAFWHKSGSKGKVKDLLKCKRVILWAT